MVGRAWGPKSDQPESASWAATYALNNHRRLSKLRCLCSLICSVGDKEVSHGVLTAGEEGLFNREQCLAGPGLQVSPSQADGRQAG
jgi:hypothetical protein